MSEFYATAPNTVRLVTNWVELGQGVMRQARTKKGLSAEAVARAISVSTKTYWRWEKAGRAPMHLADHLAEVIGLQIESQSSPVIVKFPGPVEDHPPARPEQVEALARRVEEQMRLVEKMASSLENLHDELQGASATLAAIVERLDGLDARLEPQAASRRQRRKPQQ